jgi:hypothetical protein
MDIEIDVDMSKLDVIEKKYFDALETAANLKVKKMHDYNNGVVNRKDYYVFGEKTLLSEIWKKVLRLFSLHTAGIEPKNETIKDTLLDLINYAADYYSYLEIQDKNNFEETNK